MSTKDIAAVPDQVSSDFVRAFSMTFGSVTALAVAALAIYFGMNVMRLFVSPM